MGKLDETSLLAKESFYSALSDKNISDKDYAHSFKVWETFGCETLGNYHDLYVQTDVELLFDVFENFPGICLKKYGLDLAYYYTSPGLS